MLSVGVIDETVRNAGHYLGNSQTLSLMESEYVYPSLADRESPDAWREQGSTDIYERAKVRVADVMENNYPAHITAEADAKTRAQFPIRLPEGVVSGKDGQWVKG